MYGGKCYYCQREIATTIDHVVPYSWDEDNTIENLVPACGLCNSLASNKHFESVEHKRQYIMGQRKNRANMRAICVECLLPFAYRTHSPSMFLCAECYDEEYGTQFSTGSDWRGWLKSLWLAGIPAEAHRVMKKRTQGYVRIGDREGRVQVLVDEYANIVGTDDRFAAMLMVA